MVMCATNPRSAMRPASKTEIFDATFYLSSRIEVASLIEVAGLIEFASLPVCQFN